MRAERTERHIYYTHAFLSAYADFFIPAKPAQNKRLRLRSSKIIAASLCQNTAFMPHSPTRLSAAMHTYQARSTFIYTGL